MLSSIGRAAIRRAGAGVSQKSTNRALQSFLSLPRVAAFNNVDSTISLRQFALSLLRSYATTARADKPKAKSTAKKPTAKSVTKKAAGRTKKPTKKPVKRKPKKIAAKPKARTKRVPTEAQKAAAEKKKQATSLKTLKSTALTPPKGKPSTAWTVLLSEAIKVPGAGGHASLGRSTKDASAKYQSLTTEEKEHYNHIANQNKAANELAYKKWIESYTPEAIHAANNARKSLKRRDVKPTRKLPSLVDPRLPKSPVQSIALFTKERWNSGDFKGVALPDAAPRIVKEWKELTASERKVYEDMSAADSRRYAQEYKTVFGRDPGRGKAAA